MKRITIILIIAVSFAILARGQGFLNLNFELAYNLTNSLSNGSALVSVTNALPDWTVYNGDNVLADIYYVTNNFASESLVELAGGSLALSGNFSVLLNGDSISQTGLVPDNAESLLFEAKGPGGANSVEGSGFYVTLGGQNLSYSVLSEGPDYYIYGANIPSDLDGQMDTLTFGLDGIGFTLLDDIEFSTSPIPEPGEFALVGLGVILFGVRRWRKLRNRVQR